MVFLYTTKTIREENCGNTPIHNILKENIVSRNMHDQRSEELNNESQKTLKKAIVGDSRKMEDIFCSWIGKVNVVNMTIGTKRLLQIQEIQSKFQSYSSQK